MKHENWWVAFAAASASVAIIAGAASAALAQQHTTTTVVGARVPDDVRTARVSYRDLNLAAARDERILNRRVGSAVRQVCADGNLNYFYDLSYPKCASGAWKGARPQIALAVRRAHEIAANGTSDIPLVAIAIVAH